MSTGNERVPDGWRMMRLGDVAAIRNGGAFPSRHFSPNQGLPLIRNRDLYSSETEIRYLGEYDDKYLVHQGDLLVRMDGEFQATRWKGGRALLNQRVACLVPSKRDIDLGFLDFIIQGPLFLLQHETTGTTVKHLSSGQLESLLIPLPPLEEQRGIAAVLDSIDEAIEREEAVVAATERLHDAMLHKLLTRGIPGRHSEWQEVPGLGRIPASWQVKKLGDAGRWLSGGTPSKARPDYWNGELPWVSPKDMKSRLISDTVDHVSMEGAHAGSRIAGEGAILVVVRGMILAHSFPVAVLDVAAAFNQDIRALECADNFNSKYVLAALHAQKSRLQNLPTPSTHGTLRVTSEDLFSVSIPLPPLSEQEQIADVVDGIESSIKESRAQTEVLRSLKASAAEALLTGKVRVRGK